MTETMGRTRRQRLDDMLDAARHSHQYEELAVLDPRDYPDGKPAMQSLIDDLEATIAEAREIQGHAHEWGEGDYRVVCGLDGRV